MSSFIASVMYFCGRLPKLRFPLGQLGRKRRGQSCSLKTELVMTMNIREWRHFFKLRTSERAHPQMREIARMLLEEFRSSIDLLFDDV